MTSYISSSGGISSSDSIKTAIQKLDGNIAIVSGTITSNFPYLTVGNMPGTTAWITNLGTNNITGDSITAVQFNGLLSGNSVSCNTIPGLSGDCSSNVNNVTVESVDGYSSSIINNRIGDVITATGTATANCLAKRDNNADCSFNDITVNKINCSNMGSTYNNMFIGSSPSGSYSGLGGLIILGPNAGDSISSSDRSILLGRDSEKYISTGSQNIALGWRSLENQVSGRDCISIGRSNLTNCVNSYNIGIGALSGSSVSTGTNNIFIGREANTTASGCENSIAIGYDATVSASNEIALGISSISAVRTSGILHCNSVVGFTDDDDTYAGTWSNGFGSGNVMFRKVGKIVTVSIGYESGISPSVVGNPTTFSVGVSSVYKPSYNGFGGSDYYMQICCLESNGVKIAGQMEVFDAGTLTISLRPLAGNWSASNCGFTSQSFSWLTD